jgi:2-polyprenyl-3-methyl-5-hydroxy-6-metoxy-1,4-benzoquinol methylase
LTSSMAERWTIFDTALQQLRYRKVVTYIPKGCLLADLGCGDGAFLRCIRNKTILSYGIDMQAADTHMGDVDIEYKSADLNGRIPLNDESVDIVTALAVIEHLMRPDNFFAEVLRILKPCGCCIMTTPSPRAKPVLEWLAYRLKIISENDIRDHKNYFTKKQLLGLMCKFRNHDIKSFQFGFNTIIFAQK